MKVLHCCLAAFYIDNYGYQENILPRMHKLQGHEVAILASTETYINKTKLGYTEARSYLNEDGIPVTRVPYIKWLPNIFVRKLRLYNGILDFLNNFGPDIIFLHDCQFLSVVHITAYLKHHPGARLYVDGHTDFLNSARNWVSKNILHRVIYRWCAKHLEQYTVKFYGVLPARVDFFRDVYGISNDKVDLLVLGAVPRVIDLSDVNAGRSVVRQELEFKDDDFIIVTGGKLDKRKYVHVLMQVIAELKVRDIKLIVFGTPDEHMSEIIPQLARAENIRFVGWCTPVMIQQYFLASDLAFFPGTHSVLWEEAVGLGIPCIFKRWPGIQHVDVGGNCLFIDNADPTEMKQKILLLYNNRTLLAQMRLVAKDIGMKIFSYDEIARRAIEC